MPAPQAAQMQQFARLKFTSFQLKVPHNWQEPTGDPDAEHYRMALKPEERTTPPASPPLFLPASMVKYHTDTQRMLVEEFGKFIDGICKAICSAWSTWQKAATLVGVIVNGPTATMGQVVGPPLTPLILAEGPKESPNLLKYTTAVANVIGSAWLTYTATIKVPGLPWYPAFAVFPGPLAPPTPNVPVPVIALTQVTAALMPDVLKMQMISALADPQAPYHQQLFEAIADGFDKCFKLWQASTMVTNVMGTGPIPTFAPPVVPGGPVVMGTGIMTPGGFA